jgi:hypothetical protein
MVAKPSPRRNRNPTTHRNPTHSGQARSSPQGVLTESLLFAISEAMSQSYLHRICPTEARDAGLSLTTKKGVPAPEFEDSRQQTRNPSSKISRSPRFLRPHGDVKEASPSIPASIDQYSLLVSVIIRSRVVFDLEIHPNPFRRVRDG